MRARYNQFSLGFFWFSLNFFWASVIIFALPYQIRALDPVRKDELLGWVFAVGAACSGVTQVLVGRLSDATRTRWGRRLPYIFWGCLAGSAATLAYTQASSLPALVVSFCLIQITVNLAAAPYQALIPDLAPQSGQGEASGIMGMFTLLGQVAGAKLAPLLLPSADPPSLNLSLLGLVLTGALLVGGAVTLAGVREGPLPSSGDSHPFFTGLRKNPAFQLLLLARFLTNIGFYAPYPFLQYYVQHSLGVPAQSAAQQLGVFLIYAIAAGLVGTVVVGKLSDKYDRISLVVATNAVFSVGLTGLIFARSPQQVAPWACLFGLGLGGFMAVDWALAAQLVPRKHPAQAMAFWAITFVVAQSLGSGVAGWALSAAKPHVGDDAAYRWLFAFAMVFVFLGLLPFVHIREILRKGLAG